MASLDFDKEKESFKEFYAKNGPILHDAATSLRTLLALLLADNDDFPTPQVLARVKERDECIAKFTRKYQAQCEANQIAYEIKDYITDLVGLRVICLYSSDVVHIHKVLSSNFEVLEVTDKTLAVEQEEGLFGYKGLHLDLKLDGSRSALPEYLRFREIRFEVQLRTIVQDAWSVLDHKIKYKRSIPHELKRRINRLAALFELADQEFLNIREETLEREAKAKAEPGISSFLAVATSSPVDAFSFLNVAQKHFNAYPFQGHKIDGFVEELLEVAPTLSPAEIDQALSESDETLSEYKIYQHERYRNRLNPYTAIRHSLYLCDPRFAPLLFELQRKNFDEWREARSAGQADKDDGPMAGS
jgi:putative GTP pyrophosphokinase